MENTALKSAVTLSAVTQCAVNQNPPVSEIGASKVESTSSLAPEPPVPEPTPVDDESIVRAVLSELPVCEIFTRTDILNAVRKHAPNRVREIGGRLFPAYLLRLGNTDRFIHRENEKRPFGYRGLVDVNGDGVIASDVEPF